MSKKLFVAVTGTLLTSLFTTLVVVGCSSDESSGGGDPDAGQQDVKTTDATPDRKPPTNEVDGAPPPEEGTVGNTCSSDTDCAVQGSVGDNICSKGAAQGNDLFGTPVCIQPTCTIGSGNTIDDITCDDQKGLCVPTGAGASGVCFPFCTFDSTAVQAKCQGGNKCSGAYISNGQSGALGLGFCAPSCTADADCKGTAGQKCQVETGECLTAANHVDMTGKFAKACDPTATTAACACAPSAADTKKGLCGSSCVTGTAGNTACATAGGNENWKCTAHLQASYKGNGGSTIAGYTGQPDDIVGSCALACPNGDEDCAGLSTEAGTPMTCQEFVGGSFCAFPAK